jgi:hypothetical protein
MNETNVLFFIPSKREGYEKIYSLVDKVSLLARTKVFQNTDDLSRNLCQPTDDPTIVALLAHDKKDLLDIVSIRHMLSDVPLILILPDREEGTATMGYALTPRFLTYVDSNMEEVVAVLEKMLETYNKKELEEKWHNIWKS